MALSVDIDSHPAVDQLKDARNQIYTDEKADEDARLQEESDYADIQAALAVIQIGVYASLWSDAISRRDDKISKMETMVDYAHDKDMNVDTPMMHEIQNVKDLTVPDFNPCDDISIDVLPMLDDGVGINLKMIHEGNKVCGGVPAGWDEYDGVPNAALALSYTGATYANAQKRREENFLKSKVGLMLRAQRKSRIDFDNMINGMGKSVAIDSGLANIFASGFNSASVSLGSALGN